MTATLPVAGAEPDAGPGGAVLRVVVVNGSPNEPSKTMGLVAAVLDTLGGMVPVQASRVDVYRLGPGFTGAVERDDITPGTAPEVEEALRLAEQADLLIAATPVFRGSYPGMFKHFFDLVDQYALADKLVLLVATGGSERHTLALDHALRPLFAFFQALTVPVAFFAAAGDFDGTILLNPRVYGRIEVGLTDVLDLLRTRATGGRATPPA
ncbi:NAD(P)H-dependent oxidoreductase [Pseudonocardia humida]|uniref:NAD(P)H-dependent oxidoreductase n=1 Tax=Pseudonocardia humida TaxID=2800819 RepID=A0ABT1A1I7_9PSEU|nr:NAD(P)H-dependent oxidoreductase [Pseudonocardia humida]MCO1656857.1 NAD(P)H-dependent oxidoreductase [Pseudonocardia humida]